MQLSVLFFMVFFFLLAMYLYLKDWLYDTTYWFSTLFRIISSDVFTFYSFFRTTSMIPGTCSISLQSSVASSTSSSQSFRWVLSLENELDDEGAFCAWMFTWRIYSPIACLPPHSVWLLLLSAAQIYPFMKAVIVTDLPLYEGCYCHSCTLFFYYECHYQSYTFIPLHECSYQSYTDLPLYGW